MTHDTSQQPPEDASGANAEASGIGAGTVAETRHDRETAILEAIRSEDRPARGARLSRWKLLAQQQFRRFLPKSAPTPATEAGEPPEAKPDARPAKPWARCWGYLKAHQAISACIVVAIVGGFLFAAEQWDSADNDNSTAPERSSMQFGEVEVLPPRKPAPRETAAIPEFNEAQPIRTVEHEAGPQLGGNSFESGPALSGPSLGPTPAKPASRSVWLKGTIEDVAADEPEVRRIGHVDLPATGTTVRR